MSDAGTVGKHWDTQKTSVLSQEQVHRTLLYKLLCMKKKRWRLKKSAFLTWMMFVLAGVNGKEVGQVVHSFTCFAYSLSQPPFPCALAVGLKQRDPAYSRVTNLKDKECEVLDACGSEHAELLLDGQWHELSWSHFSPHQINVDTVECKEGIHPGVVASLTPKWNCRRTYSFRSLETDSQGNLSWLQVLCSLKTLPAKQTSSQVRLWEARSSLRDRMVKQTSVPLQCLLWAPDCLHFPLKALNVPRAEMKAPPSTAFSIIWALSGSLATHSAAY